MHKWRLAWAAFSRWWRHARLPASHATAYVLLFSALFFLFGNHWQHKDIRTLENKLADARGEVRTFAREMARRSSALNSMRARDEINQKTIALLNGRIDKLENQSLHWQSQTAFYRYVLAEEAAGEILIHALDASPAFSRQQWELSAVLARPGGKRKAFEGSYYFEVVEAHADGTYTLTRLPAEKREFQMDFYHEISESVTLPPERQISNLRLIVLDKKGKLIATDDMLDEGSSENGDNGGNGNGGGNGSGDPREAVNES